MYAPSGCMPHTQAFKAVCMHSPVPLQGSMAYMYILPCAAGLGILGVPAGQLGVVGQLQVLHRTDKAQMG